MFYVYVLYNKKFYIGRTANLTQRTFRHKYAKLPHRNKDYDLIFYEVYINKKDAQRREKYFKTTKGRTTLRLMLSETLKSLHK